MGHLPFIISLAENLEKLNSPSPLMTAALSTTSNYISWNGVSNATAYKVKNVTLDTIIYNGPDLKFIETGLTINTSYDYEVIATAEGYADSDPATATQSTITFSPEFWFEAVGMQHYDVAPSNEYAETSANVILSKIKSIIGNTSQYAIPTGTSRFNHGSEFAPVQNFQFAAASVPLTLATSITNIGDFTYMYRGYIAGMNTTTIRNVFGAAADGNALRRIYSDRIRFTWGGSTVNAYWKASHAEYIKAPGHIYDIIIQREGTTLRVSATMQGEDEDIQEYTVDSSTFDIEFLNYYPSAFYWVTYAIRAGFVKFAITQSQRAEFFNYTYNGEQTLSARYSNSILPLSNVNFLTWPTNGYVAKTELNKSSGHAITKQKSLRIGDKTFMVHHYGDTNDFLNFGVVVDHATSKYQEYEIGNFGEGSDYHEHSDVTQLDGRIVNLFNDIYGSGGNRLFMKKSAANFDVSTMFEKKIYNELVGYNAGAEQYIARKQIGNHIILCQQYYDGSSTYSYGLMIKRSNDWLNEWRSKYVICDDGTRWFYPVFINNWYTTDEMLIGFQYVDPTPSPRLFEGFGLMRLKQADIASDGYTFTSFDGVTTREIPADGVRTLAQMIADFGIKDIGANTKNVILLQLQQDENGDFYGLCTDGNGGYEFIQGSLGGAFTFKAITGHGITLVDSGATSESEHFGGGIIKTATNNYSVFVLESNSGDHQVRKLTTSDKGNNWSDGGRLTTMTTSVHDNIYVTANYSEFGGGCIHATVLDGSDNYSTHYWMKEI